MRKNKYIFGLIVLAVLPGCKKYPEDPFISLRTAKQRLTREWKINRIIVNGNDQTNSYNDSLINKNFTDLTLQIGEESELTEFYGNLTGGDKERYTTLFSFKGKEKSTLTALVFSQNTANNYYDTLNVNLINNVFGKYPFKILKLYKKDFIIEATKNNNVYEIHFKN